jgi:hypothetical protein
VVAVLLEGWELQEEVLAPGEGLRPDEVEALEPEELNEAALPHEVEALEPEELNEAALPLEVEGQEELEALEVEEF